MEVKAWINREIALTFDFKVNPGLSVGCNYAFRLLSDVNVNTSITMHGYFYCKDEFSGIEILNEANLKSFTVGETFDSGLGYQSARR